MRSALLYKYGDIAYWTGNYAEGGSDLIKAAAASAEAACEPAYHIRPAELTAERRAEVDKSFKGYIRLNRKYGYRSGEQAYNGKRAKVFVPRKHRRSILETVIGFFTCEVEE